MEAAAPKTNIYSTSFWGVQAEHGCFKEKRLDKPVDFNY